MAPESVYGVDFSGAMNAHRLIWVAKCRPDGQDLVLEECWPIGELDGALDRDSALKSLRGLVVSKQRALFGMDFPFSVPEKMWPGGDWVSFATSMSQKWPDAVGFRAAMLYITGGKEPKRTTDEDAKTPFCSVNLRIFRQTYYGIGHVLGPLVQQGNARVLPFQSSASQAGTVIEVCPASTLGSIGIKSAGYKGKTPARGEKRRQILRRFETDFNVQVSDSTLREIIVSDQGGDALDAVIAASAAFAALQRGDLSTGDRDSVEAREGRVYFRL